MEWKSFDYMMPPKNGRWILALNRDNSGADILAFWDDEWVNASGEGGLLEAENIDLHYSLWAEMPPTFSAWCEVEARKERYAQWRESVRARFGPNQS